MRGDFVESICLCILVPGNCYRNLNSLKRYHEITWAIVEHKQGMGIAMEAAIRSKKYAYETLGWDTVYSCISAENTASIRLAEKLGATVDREVKHETRGNIIVYLHS